MASIVPATLSSLAVPAEKAWPLRLLPSLSDFALLIPVLLLCFVFPDGLNTLLGDGDTGWHIRTGQWILSHGAVPQVDVFSFTRSGQPWFAWEWSWDVAAAAIHSAFGLGGIVFANLVVLCLVALLFFRAVRSACNNDLLALALTMVGLFASAIHWLARPHLVSWLFFLLIGYGLRAAGAGRRAPFFWMPALLLIWANVHASFPLGIFLMLLSAAAEAIEGWSESANWHGAWLRCKPYLLCALASLGMTLLNPYGWHVHEHIWKYLGNSALLDGTQEFQSPSFHHGLAVVFGWLLLPGMAAALWCFQKRRWAGLFAIVAFSHLALNSARNIPLFVFVACPAIAAMLEDVLGPVVRSYLPAVARWSSDLQRQFITFERTERCYALPALVLGYIGVMVATAQPRFAIGFSARHFPVAALDTVAAARPERLLTTDQWGDYFLYRLFPATRVFVDGRGDFFGASYLDRCRNILNARWDAEADISRSLVDMVVISPETPLATVLKQSRDWSVLFDNGSQIVFERRARALQPPAHERAQVSTVLSEDGGKRLEADLAFKFRTQQ